MFIGALVEKHREEEPTIPARHFSAGPIGTMTSAMRFKFGGRKLPMKPEALRRDGRDATVEYEAIDAEIDAAIDAGVDAGVDADRDAEMDAFRTPLSRVLVGVRGGQ
jgi:hypothetical protein